MSRGDILWDTDLNGFSARKLASGKVTYGLKYVNSKTGKQRWLSLGLHGALTPELARRRAEIERGRIAGGADPQGEKEEQRTRRKGIITVNDLLDRHLTQYVEARGLRSQSDIKRIFDKYVRPEIGKDAVNALRRSHIVRLLDAVAAKHGPAMADHVLAHVRKALNWYATRDDEFVVPIVRGMAQTRPKDRARDRIHADPELRALWKATELDVAGVYGTLVRVLLLTGQRREEVAGMRRSEIEGNVWTIPGGRAKNGRPNVVPLTSEVIALLDELPQYGDFLFGRTGESPFGGFSRCKESLDRQMKLELPSSCQWKPWVVHDLRRSARSLMARAGVRPDIAERVLNHIIGGVQGVYDRHHYTEEKREALEALGRLVKRILGQADNVVRLDRSRPTVTEPTAPSIEAESPGAETGLSRRIV
ncbi:MAG TPA: tyrosine-type recombinase/integrase [Rhizomicrobium sp.]